MHCEKHEEHEIAVSYLTQTMPDGDSIETMATVFRMLSEPSRLKIVLTLMQGELCVYHIAEACKSTQSATSHQLRVLKDNKIIKSRREGKNILYSVSDDHILNIVRMSILHLSCKE